MLKEMKQQFVKEAIITETRRQLLVKGIRQTTLRGIARELGVAFGNIYYYYKSKVDLCEVLWMEYTHGYLDQFEHEIENPAVAALSGLDKLKYYYQRLLDYFYDNNLYAELIAYLMGEKPRSAREPRDIRERSSLTRERIQQTLIDIYREAMADGSIRIEITDIRSEAWSFNVCYVAIIINMIRYHEIDERTYSYFMESYFKRLN